MASITGFAFVRLTLAFISGGHTIALGRRLVQRDVSQHSSTSTRSAELFGPDSPCSYHPARMIRRLQQWNAARVHRLPGAQAPSAASGRAREQSLLLTRRHNRTHTIAFRFSHKGSVYRPVALIAALQFLFVPRLRSSDLCHQELPNRIGGSNGEAFHEFRGALNLALQHCPGRLYTVCDFTSPCHQFF